MKLKNNSSGFTLIEISVALGISAVVVLGASGLFKTSVESGAKTNERVSSNIYFDEMAKTISNRLTCGETLNALTVGSTVSKIQKNGKALYSVGQVVGKDATLSSMKLEQNPGWTPTADEYGPARLKVQVAHDGASITKYFPISVQLDKNKKVIGCSQKLELANVNEDMYKEVCTSAVGGYMSGGKCYWTKPVVTIVSYIPAPAPVAPAGNACFGPVCDEYLSQLGRYPDAGGKAYWEEMLASTGTMAGIVSGIGSSKEANGQAWGAADWAHYNTDITNRGMTMEYATQQCGVTISC